jgi:hypothetical protein
MELNIVGGSFIGLSNDVKTRSKHAALMKKLLEFHQNEPNKLFASESYLVGASIV